MRNVVVAVMLLGLALATPSARQQPDAVRRFLSDLPEPVTSYRAFRRLEASSPRFKQSAWLEADTWLGPNGPEFVVLREGGSERIRNRVLRAALEAERELWATRDRGALDERNYTFVDAGRDGEFARVTLMPLRKDRLLVDGVLLLQPETGDLLELRGRLVKSPSFWVSRVDVIRRYRRIAGLRVPVSVESTASVRLAGPSTFVMTYDYRAVNDVRLDVAAIGAASLSAGHAASRNP